MNNYLALKTMDKKIREGEYGLIDKIMNIKYTYEDLINVVILPEMHKALIWPSIKYPSSSRVQKFMFKINGDSEIKFFPGKIFGELEVDGIALQIAKNTKYMKNSMIYACSLQIDSGIIFYESKMYNKGFRIIYQNPNYCMGEDNETVWKLRCSKAGTLKIVRHIQFICYPEYNELFESDVYDENPHDRDMFNYYMGVYNQEKIAGKNEFSNDLGFPGIRDNPLSDPNFDILPKDEIYTENVKNLKNFEFIPSTLSKDLNFDISFGRGMLENEIGLDDLRRRIDFTENRNL